jgi:hypothetical protein
MAIASKGAPGLDYQAFRRKLVGEGFTGMQTGPLKLRLELLESFMELPATAGAQYVELTTRARKQPAALQKPRGEDEDRAWRFEAGTLTIVDLSCPFVDDSAACALFTICLDLFLENRGDVGRMIALDEAHKVGHPAPPPSYAHTRSS